MVLVRDARIELAPQPWEGRVLPLNQSRGYNDIILCGHRESNPGVELGRFAFYH